jgi:8-oxo-dGTP pyrophosphatase MutT (NUDIX family)
MVMTVATPRPASTVVLLRPSASRFDVFMVRRHDNVAFMGGAHVFPGGRVDEGDRFLGEAAAYQVAAVRELFEEAGILLARGPGGEVVGFGGAEESARVREYRVALASGAMSMRDLVERERLDLALDRLAWFAHWVTPEIEIKRYDTRFFVASAPAGQHAVHDEHETTHGEWIDPAAAVERCRRDEIALPPPTWTTLRALARFATVDEVFGWAASRPVVRVQPGFIKDERVTMLTLPGDPTYPPIEGFETPEETRFILTGGRWRPATAGRAGSGG